MLIGRILWWSEKKTSGLVQVVDEQGIVHKYFLLESQITQRPKKIQANQYVKFQKAVPAKREGFLPFVINAIVSEHPFVDPGADALKAGV